MMLATLPLDEKQLKDCIIDWFVRNQSIHPTSVVLSSVDVGNERTYAASIQFELVPPIREVTTG